jgi:hypothetical protein
VWPGADPKRPPATPSSAPAEKHQRHSAQQMPQLAVASPAPARNHEEQEAAKGEKAPGIGTALLGLALYLINSGRDKKRE